MTTIPDDMAAAKAAMDAEVQAIWDEDEPEGTDHAQVEPGDASGAEPVSDLPEDQPEVPPTARQPAPKTTPAAAEPDIWANADPALIAWRDRTLAEKAAIEQRQRSEAGRVTAYQRRYEELRARTAAPQKTDEPEDNSDLNAVIEEYPDLAKPILRQLDQTRAEIEAMKQEARSREEIAAAEREAFMTAEEAKLTAKHSNWLDLTTVDDGAGGKTAAPEFIAWYRRQPADLQAKVERNANGITNADEAAEVIGAFSAFMDRFNQPATPTPPPADRRRQRQLDASKAVTSRPQVATGGAVPKDGDPAAIWEEEDRLYAARNARR